ncbi:L-aminoadipate-semialdehyde dehydrogenase-phosphopantetheinyl transferase [Trichogramma pretiosum]|uniref:L-aminoadipate-semialdehyde dehydrogenase-phosphopantetheinyl transferase n=1 Tax=Trichogramma pretiosum TaxID=7493 RepID=UPI0006C9740B|nr:L-aminoadipate-semialdehyde dehydrogenase-phosphopantetheinyl transferase [Trichogramma pretiosum]
MTGSVRWAFNFAKWEPSEKELLLATSCIQLEEKIRIAKFVFQKDFKAALVGRLLTRKFIKEASGLPYNEICVTRDVNNKPIFEHHSVPKLNFNVSHQGSLTVFAGETRKVNIGVDVMKLEYTGGKSIDEFFKIMNRQFTDNEWKVIKGCSSSTNQDKISRFCRHWALKEAYTKALGMGLTIDLRKIDFKIKSSLEKNKIIQDTVVYVNDERQNFLFEESLVDNEHVVTVALENQSPYSESNLDLMKFKILTPADLLRDVSPLLPEDINYCKNYFSKDVHR